MLHAGLPVLHYHTQAAVQAVASPAVASCWQVMSGPGVLGQTDYSINSISQPTPSHITPQWPSVPVLGKTGSELLLAGGGRNGVSGEAGHHPGYHPMVPSGLDPAPHMTGSVMFNNVNSFYSPAHNSFGHSLLPPSHTVHYPATVRPVSSRGPGDAPDMVASMRHPSGGSLTGGSVGSHTPPSPEDRAGSGQGFKHTGVIMDRGSGVRNSFEQRQCNSVGSDQPSGSPGGGPPYRLLQPPSPATQKSPFDMSTMGMSKSSVGISPGQPGAPSAFSSTGVRSSSVISSAVRTPASPYNIKQEPGSPASRGLKEATNTTSPHSPRNVNLSPPPNNGGGSSFTGGKVHSRLGGSHTGNGASGSQGFNFPSPQPSPAAGESSVGGNNNHANSNNNNSRPGANGGTANSKFRYPSGPSQVQNMSPGDSTSTSAMSSREGTPGPARQWCADNESAGPAPNVDISHVTVKEEFGQGLMRPYDTASHPLDDYSRRPSVNLSYPASAAVSSASDTYSSHLGATSYAGYHHSMPQQVALPPRSFHPMRPVPGHPGLHGAGSLSSRSLGLSGGSDSSSHSNVKIGRRPAHLPKVLKFSDNTLPHGWVRKLKQRKHGKQAGRWDVYIYSPCGVKFASRKKLRHFFEKNNLQYDPEDFDFTPYGRHIEQSGGHSRHHSSSDGVHRSPSSVSSPTSSYSSPSIHPEYKPDFIGPSSHVPPAAHRPYMHPHHQPSMFPTDYNPMMESPPNANALEVPQHQILNLSQPQVIPNSLGLRHSSIAPPHTSSNFPPDIATILNEGGDQSQYRPSLREGYSGGSEGLASAPHHARTDQLPAAGPTAAASGASAGGPPEVAGEAGGGGSAAAADERDKKGESMGEDTRFMTRTYNLLTASQDDLGEMMDEYNLYPE